MLFRTKWKGGDGKTRTASKWSVQFYVGGKLFRRSLGTADKHIAQETALALLKREERRAAGLLDPAEEHQTRPLESHLKEFQATLIARGCSDDHVEDRLHCLREFAGRLQGKTVRALDVAPLTAWISDLKKRGLAARTINKRIQAAKQFGRWLAQNRRVAFDPFVTVGLLNADVDRRHVRRALAPAELDRLLRAAEQRPLADAVEQRVNTGVTPPERRRLLALGKVRALVYAVAAGTGLRRGELARLRWQDVDLDRGEVAIPAVSAKSRVDQSVPLRSDLKAALAAHRPTDVLPAARVFLPRVYPTLRTFKKDLVAAGLATEERAKGVPSGQTTFDAEDDSGRCLDFHSLRMTFVTSLVAAGVHPRVAQALARHAKIETTMKVYTDVHSLDLKGAVEKTAASNKPRQAAGA